MKAKNVPSKGMKEWAANVRETRRSFSHMKPKELAALIGCKPMQIVYFETKALPGNLTEEQMTKLKAWAMNPVHISEPVSLSATPSAPEQPQTNHVNTWIDFKIQGDITTLSRYLQSELKLSPSAAFLAFQAFMDVVEDDTVRDTFTTLLDDHTSVVENIFGV